MTTPEERNYDVVVIGSGRSGRTVSLRLAKNRLSVALVESELVGGGNKMQINQIAWIMY
jgi:pyruvate/2-oxoglutarate dehydrogenase complex dihydrolipoamide dehydrogenase (E3) component